MRTMMKVVGGKEHIVEGSSQDYMMMVNGIGMMQNETLTSITGEKFKVKDIMMMSQVADPIEN
ncbi:hypothetical protein CSV67_02790 [Sporosarcina sp. P2]|uniref:hypothetical protein n=1 Tax=Sporosarcina sp. P2 TaxID=2048251 RepID=UPI000C1660AD|nr:hypothetical protein [Sporosarcina sp. P2]PID03586.1 hypothetical protein CSV67_02790 [Sporosarcina sp. P2]